MNKLTINKSNLIMYVASLLIAFTAVFASATSIMAAKPSAVEGAKPSNVSIVDIVLADDDEFDVLQAAVIRAGLVSALDGNRQYTVFAPTDAAFVSTLGVADEAAAIEAVNSLPLDALSDILGYHVTKGRHISTSVLASPSYKMLNGDRLSRTDLASAGIESTDISASNGVVHVINSVLLP